MHGQNGKKGTIQGGGKVKVTEIQPNIVALEYRQEQSDKDYGSCLWARFYFNLDRYELTIVSDCGECQ